MQEQSTFLCACGCGGILTPTKQRRVGFLHGHNRRGHPENHRVYPSVEDRFWARVDRSDPEGCWPWTGFRNPKGYGQFRGEHGTTQTHRFAYRSTFGPVPPGQWVCHRCDNPPCCRPDHLFAASAAQNSLDMTRKGRGTAGRTWKMPGDFIHWSRRNPERARAAYRRMWETRRAKKAS